MTSSTPSSRRSRTQNVAWDIISRMRGRRNSIRTMEQVTAVRAGGLGIIILECFRGCFRGGIRRTFMMIG